MEHSSMPRLHVLQVPINVWFSTNSKQPNVIPLLHHDGKAFSFETPSGISQMRHPQRLTHQRTGEYDCNGLLESTCLG